MIAALGLGFLVVSAAAAVRFLTLARKTRELPELYLGLISLCLGAAVVFGLVPGTAFRVLATSLSVGGAIANALFIASMLQDRRTRSIGKGMAAALVLVLMASFPLGFQAGEPGSHLRLVGCAACFFFGTLAFGRHALQLKKRRALGLASPLEMVAFGLLGAAEGSLAIAVLIRAAGVGLGATPAEISAVQLPLAVLAALFGWLAVVPPAWFRTWMERLAEAEPA